MIGSHSVVQLACILVSWWRYNKAPHRWMEMEDDSLLHNATSAHEQQLEFSESIHEYLATPILLKSR